MPLVTGSDNGRPAQIVAVSNGDVYVLQLDSFESSPYDFSMYKSVGGTATCTRVDFMTMDELFGTGAASGRLPHDYAMVVDSTDLIHIAYGSNTGDDTPNGWDYSYLTFDPATDTFGTPSEIMTGQSTVTQMYCDLGIDASDNLHFIGEPTRKVMGVNKKQADYSMYNGSVWSSVERVNSDTAYPASHPAINVGASDVIYALYWANNPKRKTTRAKDGTWGTETVYSSAISVNYPGEIGITSDDVIYNIHNYYASPYDLWIDGADSGINCVDPATNGITADAYGNAYIIYDEGSSKDTRIIINSGSGWGSPVTLHAGTNMQSKAFHQYHSQHNNDTWIYYVYGPGPSATFGNSTLYFARYDVSLPAEGFPVSQLPRLRHISHIVSR